MPSQTTLSREKEVERTPLLGAMVRAQKEAGKPAFAQAYEMLALRRGFGGLTPEEYVAYQLYDDRLHDADGKRRFLGVRAEHAVDRICNGDDRWRGAVKDKIVFAAMMRGLGFPVPALVALHHARRRCFMARDLRTREDLAAFLRALPRPVFGKPAGSRWSLGAASLTAYDPAQDAVTTLSGAHFPVDALVDQIAGFAEDGYLFQERLEPHPAIAQACGPAIGTVRLLTAQTDDGPMLIASAWKVVAGDNVADNFWRKGNMLAAVDGATGTVERVASGLGHASCTHEEHPDTGVRLLGMTLPDWDEARTTCLAAATALAGLRLIGWDVALTPRGPVIVEANTLPAFNLHQVATGRGLLDDRFAAFIESCRRGRPARPLL